MERKLEGRQNGRPTTSNSVHAGVIVQVACPGCSQALQNRLQAISGEYEIHKCTACGLSFCNPMKAGDASFYEENEGYDDKWEFDVVASMLRSHPAGLEILDIGCGDGRFLGRISSIHRVRGIDFNRRAIDSARARGIDVLPLSLDEHRDVFPDARYDVITAFHVLEHMADPSALIEEIKGCLKSSGVIAISVPNANRWTLSLTTESWDYPPHHLTRWNQEALSSFLSRHGLVILHASAEPITTWRQVQSGMLDLVHTFASRQLSFGVVKSLRDERQAGHKMGGSTRRRVADLLAGAKVSVLVALSSVLSVLSYPVLRLSMSQGKSFLIVARRGAKETN